jgi:hypothetical protein
MDRAVCEDIARRAYAVRSEFQKLFGFFFPKVLVTMTGGTDTVVV